MRREEKKYFYSEESERDDRKKFSLDIRNSMQSTNDEVEKEEK